jgi:phosphoheptose isomerase
VSDPRRFVRRAFAAVALTTDSSFLTANANDFGFEHVFARQLGLRTVALTGVGGGQVARVADVCIELVEQELCSA